MKPEHALQRYTIKPPTELTSLECKVLVSISLYMWTQPLLDGGWIQCPVSELQRILSLPPRTFGRGIEGVVSKGYVERRRKFQQPRFYRLTGKHGKDEHAAEVPHEACLQKNIDYAEIFLGRCLLMKNGLDEVMIDPKWLLVESYLRAYIAGTDKATLESCIRDMNQGREKNGLEVIEIDPINAPDDAVIEVPLAVVRCVCAPQETSSTPSPTSAASDKVWRILSRLRRRF